MDAWWTCTGSSRGLRPVGAALSRDELQAHVDVDGSPDRDRTCCLLVRSQVLCPHELRGRVREFVVGLDGVEPIDLPDVGGVL